MGSGRNSKTVESAVIMTRIYFVRHAEPVHSHADDRTRPLTEAGMQDTALVLETLRDKHINVFYCSPYQRSMDTIRSAAQWYGLPIQTDERLRERQAGQGGNQWNGLGNQSPLHKRWADFTWAEPGGETIGSVQARNVAALFDILEANPDKNIVIGTHGTALSSILNFFNPHFGVEDFLRIVDWMPYIIELDFDGQKLVGMQELAHIEKEYH